MDKENQLVNILEQLDSESSHELKRAISTHPIVFLPEKYSCGGCSSVVYREHVGKFLKYVANTENSDVVFVPNSTSSILHEHASVRDFGKVVLTQAVLPLFISLVGNYIYDYLVEDDAQISIEIIERDQNSERIIKFKGDVEEFKKIYDSVRDINVPSRKIEREDSRTPERKSENIC